MQVLRRSTFLARLILAWFVLSMGVAIASPLLKSQDVGQVCTSLGAIMIVADAGTDGSDPVSAKTMDCPLCVPAAEPPPPVVVTPAPAHPLSYALQGIASAILAARTAAPLPARGPPTLS